MRLTKTPTFYRVDNGIHYAEFKLKGLSKSEIAMVLWLARKEVRKDFRVAGVIVKILRIG